MMHFRNKLALLWRGKIRKTQTQEQLPTKSGTRSVAGQMPKVEGGVREQVCAQKPGPWAAGVAQRFSATFSPGPDPRDLGSSPTLGSLHGACFSLCL